ncbi:MAG: hypothetical protein ACJ0HT_01470, partial [Alphaproteobacteria bacterium]
EYFSAIGLRGHYAEYEGQPFSEFTPESCADRRDWVIGTPDDAIAWLDAKMEETGGFGGLLLHSPEWTNRISGNAQWKCSHAMLCPTSKATIKPSKVSGIRFKRKPMTVKFYGIQADDPVI